MLVYSPHAAGLRESIRQLAPANFLFVQLTFCMSGIGLASHRCGERSMAEQKADIHLAIIGKSFAQSCTLLQVCAKQSVGCQVLFCKGLLDILRKTIDRQRGRWLVP